MFVCMYINAMQFYTLLLMNGKYMIHVTYHNITFQFGSDNEYSDVNLLNSQCTGTSICIKYTKLM